MLWTLLKYRFLSSLAAFKQGKKGLQFLLLILVIGLAAFSIFSFAFGVYQYSVLNPLQGGRFLTNFVALAFHSVFIIVIYTGLSTAVFSLFFGKELALLLSLPIKPLSVHIYKMIEAILLNSRMSIMLLVPSLIILGIYYRAGIGFYLVVGLVTILMASIPGSIGIIIAGFLSRHVAASRLKGLLTAIGGFIGLAIWIGMNLLNRFDLSVTSPGDHNITNLQSIVESPVFAWLPSGWAYYSAINAGQNNWLACLGHAFLLALTSLFLAMISISMTKKYFSEGVREELPEARSAASVFLNISGSPLKAHLRRDFLLLRRESGVYWGSLIIGIMMVFIPLFTSSGDGEKFAFLGFSPIIALFAAIWGGQIGKGLVPLERLGFWWNLVTPSGQRLALVSKYILGLIFVVVGSILIGTTHLIFSLASDINYMILMMSFSVLGFAIGLPVGLYFADFKWENPKRMIRASGNFASTAYTIIGAVILFGIVFAISKTGIGEITVSLASLAISIFILALSMTISAIKFQNIEWY